VLWRLSERGVDATTVLGAEDSDNRFA